VLNEMARSLDEEPMGFNAVARKAVTHRHRWHFFASIVRCRRANATSRKPVALALQIARIVLARFVTSSAEFSSALHFGR
jgi:hypothetical protein